MSAAVDVVEAEVRELVRRRGLDPVVDRMQVRCLVDEVVRDYDERALTSSLVPLQDPHHANRVLYDAVAGYGPLQRHLDDPEVEEICVNGRPTDGWSGVQLRRKARRLEQENEILRRAAAYPAAGSLRVVRSSVVGAWASSGCSAR